MFEQEVKNSFSFNRLHKMQLVNINNCIISWSDSRVITGGQLKLAQRTILMSELRLLTYSQLIITDNIK